MTDLPVYAGLFLTAFAAATVFPLQSEALVVGLLLGGYPPPLVVGVASVGNVLGSVVNWGLGRGLERWQHHRWAPRHGAALDRARRWYHRWGKWSLMLSWAPIIGDPLTVVAGVMRERLAVFVGIVALAKTGRYVTLAALTLAPDWQGLLT